MNPVSEPDVCVCGDYRSQHAGPEHMGRCLICNSSAHNAPWDICSRFRSNTPEGRAEWEASDDFRLLAQRAESARRGR